MLNSYSLVIAFIASLMKERLIEVVSPQVLCRLQSRVPVVLSVDVLRFFTLTVAGVPNDGKFHLLVVGVNWKYSLEVGWKLLVLGVVD